MNHPQHESVTPRSIASRSSWRRRATRVVATSLLLGATVVAQAGPYSAEVVFGDSLSDNGNLAEGVYGVNFPNPPSYHDSFTNGPVAAQLLATRLGLGYDPSLWLTGGVDVHGLFGPSFQAGTNYATAAATASAQALGGLPGINLPMQVAAYGAKTGGVADANALYVIDIGGNDVRNAALKGTGAAAVTAGVQAELTAIQSLIGAGAKNFFIVDVPNVGVIPEFAQDNPTLAASATTFSQMYDAMLMSGLASLALPAGVKLTTFDLYAFNTNLLMNPAAYGLLNTTDRCYTNTPLTAATTTACGPNAENIDSFAYWDSIHPTETVQALWANGFAAALGVPEPSSVVLLGLGLVALVGARRRR